MQVSSTRNLAIQSNRAPARATPVKPGRQQAGSFPGIAAATRTQRNTPDSSPRSSDSSRQSGLVGLGLSQPYQASPLAVKAASQETPSRKFSALEQNWLDANTGKYANLLVNNVNRTEPYGIDSVDINWVNASNGSPQSLTRAVGNVNATGGAELAKLLGGTLVDSPFNTFGTTKKDQYIRLGNGQMIDASVLANSLNNARLAKDPVAATQDVLNLYRSEAESYNLNRSTDAQDLVTKGQLTPGSLPT